MALIAEREPTLEPGRLAWLDRKAAQLRDGIEIEAIVETLESPYEVAPELDDHERELHADVLHACALVIVGETS